MKFNKAKRKVLHMDRGNPKHKYRLGREWIERSPEGEDLGVLVDEKLSMTQQCVLAAQKASCALGCIPSSVGSRVREGVLPLCSALVRPPPGVVYPALEPSAQDRHGPVGAAPEEATAMVREQEHLCCAERLRELGLFILEKRRLWEDLRAAYQYLKGPARKLERDFLQGPVGTEQGVNGFRLKEGRFRLDIRKKFFTLRLVRPWHRLSSKDVDVPSMAVFKARLDGALSKLV